MLRKAGITYHEREATGAESDQGPAVGAFLLGHGWYVGAAPVPGGRTNIGIVVPASRLANGPDEAIRRTRGVMAGAGGAMDRAMVALPLRHSVSKAVGGGFLLVGDACGFVDPLTGEGLHRALVSSEYAADAITRWSRRDSNALEDYDRRLRRRFRNKDVVSWILQAFLAQPALLDYAVRRLATRQSNREVFTHVLTDQVPASRALDPHFLLSLLAP
jgi:flavin-dependent dehydrogenase